MAFKAVASVSVGAVALGAVAEKVLFSYVASSSVAVDVVNAGNASVVAEGVVTFSTICVDDVVSTVA